MWKCWPVAQEKDHFPQSDYGGLLMRTKIMELESHRDKEVSRELGLERGQNGDKMTRMVRRTGVR